MDLIAECAARSDASQNVRRILERIADVGNVPRNKKKFGTRDGPIFHQQINLYMFFNRKLY